MTKLNKLANTIIHLIPDEFPIFGTDLYIEGGLSGNFEIKKDFLDIRHLMIPLDISLQ